jgi:hypothetical protein
MAFPVMVLRQSTENPDPFAFLQRTRIQVPWYCFEKHAVLARLWHSLGKKTGWLDFLFQQRCNRRSQSLEPGD